VSLKNENASGFKVHDLRLVWLHRNLINPRIKNLQWIL